MCPKHPMMDSARLFDWPACFQAFSNRPDKSPRNKIYTVAHSTVVPETSLHFAVVRSRHSRPAPFRFRFQNARSVRMAFSRSEKLYVHATLKK